MNSQLEAMLRSMTREGGHGSVYSEQVKWIVNLFKKQEYTYYRKEIEWPTDFSNSRENIIFCDYLRVKQSLNFLANVALSTFDQDQLREGIRIFKEENAETIAEWEEIRTEREVISLGHFLEEEQNKVKRLEEKLQTYLTQRKTQLQQEITRP